MKRFKCTNVVLEDYVICITLLCKSCPELRSHSDCLTTIGTISPFNTKKHNMENITDPTSLNDDDDDDNNMKTKLPNTTNPTPR